MNDHCQACGVEAHEGTEFTEEGLPPFWKKVYCPECLKNFYNRFYLGMAAITVGLAFIGVWRWAAHGVSVGESIPLRLALFVVFQWIMIFGHELGHAVAGRMMGYKNIRIMVGSGKPLGEFHWLGFPWLIKLVPVGGVTIADAPDEGSRRKALTFVAGGPAVNVIAAVAAWGFMSQEGGPASLHGLAQLFLLANLAVLVENLYPYHMRTPFGLQASDGLLLEEIWQSGRPGGGKQPAHWRYLLAVFCKWALGLAVLAAGG